MLTYTQTALAALTVNDDEAVSRLLKLFFSVIQESKKIIPIIIRYKVLGQ